MNFITLITAINSAIFIFMGLYILFKDKKNPTNILFAVSCFVIFLDTFWSSLTSAATEPERMLLFFKLSFAAFIFIYPLLLIFFIRLTGLIKFKFISCILILVPAVFLVFFEFLVPNENFLISNYSKYNGYWKFDINYGLLTLITNIYFHTFILLSAILLFLWMRRAPDRKSKMQARIILFFYLTITLIISFEFDIISLFTNYNPLIIEPMIYVFLMAGIFWAIVKYRFLSITPEVVSNDVFSNIDESIIILDMKFRVIRINDYTRSLLNFSSDNIKPDLSDYFMNTKNIKSQINLLRENKEKYFMTRVRVNTEEPLYIDIKASLVKDKFNDSIGFLIIGKEARGVRELQKYFGITSREIDIIQKIIMGETYKSIADSLDISENTVKSHISNIYTKCRVENKVQMFNFLKDFNLVPE